MFQVVFSLFGGSSKDEARGYLGFGICLAGLNGWSITLTACRLALERGKDSDTGPSIRKAAPGGNAID